MRLICPNCGVQYDVADDAIPAGGRDVQCSSCNHTWFQTSTQFSTAPDEDGDGDDGVDQTPPPPQPVRRPIDTSISDILREEAAREQQLRASRAGSPPKTQEDTSPKAVIDAEETRKRIAQMTEAEGSVRVAPVRNPEEGARVAAPGINSPRVKIHEPAVDAGPNPRDTPSMNEINTRLRARSESSESHLTETEEQEVVRRRGFRRGFAVVILVFAILLAPYVFADQITDNFPQSQDAMTSYVATVDQLRLTIDRAITSLGETIAGFTTDVGVEEPAQN